MSEIAEARSLAAEPLRCPSCLAVHEPEQRYCLECGTSLHPRPASRLSARGADPLLPALAVVALLAAGIGLVWAVGPDDERPDVPFVATAALTEPAATTVTGDGGLTDGTDTGLGDTTGVPGAGTETVSGVPGTETAPTTTEPSTVPDEPADTSDSEPEPEPSDEWPAGESSWAVILISEEREEHTEAEMETLRQAAQSAGLTKVGLLLSDNHSSLNAGYRVLYQGPFATRAAADQAALAAKEKGYPSAYPRRVAP